MIDDCGSDLVAAWREKLNAVDDMRFRQAMLSRLDKLEKRRINGDPVDRMWLRLEEDYDKFLKQRQGRLAEYAALLKREYPAHLPLVGELENIKNTIKAHQVVIVCGSTGSGKSTQLPKILLDCGYGCRGRIGCTQPRRIAAVAMARRVAHECGGEANNLVASQVRFDDRSSESTVIKFMTDGILLAETRNDPDLRQYDALIIDEAHERSLNIDFILGYLQLLLERRKDLKVIISSATLDAENFAEFFPDSGIITVEGRSFEVEDYFMPPLEDEDLSGNVGRAVDFIREFDNSGDILVFLPGEREIRDAADLLTGRRLPRCEILPLYGRLSMGEQQRVFSNSSGGNRRIVLATNVAETSLTIPNITYVIDSGLARISRYNPRTQVQELQIEQISQASAKQRRGRCGRIREGICIHLYSEDDLSRSREYTEPEIRRTSLAGVILQMAILRLPEINHFPFIDPPQSVLIREGIRTLTEIGALNGKGQVTAAGRKIAALPLDPHLGKMICESERLKVLPEVMVVASYLSIQDPRERPSDAQQAADQAHKRFCDEKSDFMVIINLWNFIQQERSNGLSNNGIRKLCIKNFLNYKRISEWRNFVCDLAEYAEEYNWDL
ncbi:MAG: ATP-dependent RNA helicase HrpA, partial [Victivallaceae bacterium]